MADLVELVAHVDDGFLRLQDAAQVDRRAAQHEVARSRVNRLLELLDLLRAVAHRGQDLAAVRIFLVRLLDRADRVVHGAHDLRGADPLGRNVGRAVLHAAVGQSRAVLDREDLLPADLHAVVRRDGRGRLDDDHIRIHAPDVLLHDLDVLRRRGIDLVDHDDVGHTDVRLARVVGELVSGTERVRDDDVQARFEDRRIVVPAIPQEDLRLGHELSYYPGETNVRMADVIVINKVDTATPENIEIVKQNIRSVNPDVVVVEAASPITPDDTVQIRGKKVLAIEDGPTLTHGGMEYGAAYIAAQRFGAAEIVSAVNYAVGSIKETYKKYPNSRKILPAMGYGPKQIKELEETIDATPCDLVLSGTPIDLSRVLKTKKPVVHVRYELDEIGHPNLE